MSSEKQGLQPLIDALRTGTESQRSEAVGALRLLSGEDHGVDPDSWQRWWDRSRAEFMGEARPGPAPLVAPGAPGVAPFSGIPDPDLIPRPSGRTSPSGRTITARGSSGISITMIGAVFLLVVFGYIYFKLKALGIIDKVQGLSR